MAHVSAANIFTLLIKASAMVTVYRTPSNPLCRHLENRKTAIFPQWFDQSAQNL